LKLPPPLGTFSEATRGLLLTPYSLSEKTDLETPVRDCGDGSLEHALRSAAVLAASIRR
jgi:hypothetical protein